MTIPIIGQPQVLEYFITMLVRCPCGQSFQMVGQPGSMRVCPGKTDCGRIFRMDMFPAVIDGEPSAAPVAVSPDGSTFHCRLAMGFTSKEPPPLV